MMTKIRTNGSSDTSMLSPPPNGPACAKAGVTNIVSSLLKPRNRPLFARSCFGFAAEIGADYSGRGPNCNVGTPGGPQRHPPLPGGALAGWRHPR